MDEAGAFVGGGLLNPDVLEPTFFDPEAKRHEAVRLCAFVLRVIP